MELLVIRFLESDTVVLSSIFLGVVVALGLVIREKAQGGENMKLIQKERAEMFEAHNAMRAARPTVDQN
jgi:preprotein translocase subunit SecG